MEELAEEISHVYTMWNRYGGSFTQALASALLHADMNNAFKIKMCFSKEWEEALDQWKKVNDK